MRIKEEHDIWILMDYIKLEKVHADEEGNILEETAPYYFQADLRINEIDNKYSVVAHVTVETSDKDVSENEIRILAIKELRNLLDRELSE